jgi:transposase
VRGKRGRPKRRPASVVGDRGYQGKAASEQLRRRKIRPLIAKQRSLHGSGLGTQRWVVERTISWLHQHRRLRIRYERRRRPRSVPLDRLQPDLPQSPPRVILIEALTWSETSRGAARLGCPLGLEQRSVRSSDGGSD